MEDHTFLMSSQPYRRNSLDTEELTDAPSNPLSPGSPSRRQNEADLAVSCEVLPVWEELRTAIVRQKKLYVLVVDVIF